MNNESKTDNTKKTEIAVSKRDKIISESETVQSASKKHMPRTKLKKPTEKQLEKIKKINISEKESLINQITTMSNNNETGKVIVLEMKKKLASFEKLSPFAIKKQIDSICGEVIRASKTRDGRLVVTTKNGLQAEKLLKITTFLSQDCKAAVDEKSNKSIGVIYHRDLIHSEDEEIIENLAGQKVLSIRRCKKKGQDGQTYDTGLFFVTFDCPKVPQELKIGYEIVDVREFIPEPLRCFKCLKFGHVQTICKTEESKCGNCSDTAHTDRSKGEKCDKRPRCTNCGENDHGSFSKQCAVYKAEKEIVGIRTREKIPHNLARAKYFKQNPLGKRSFASIARSGIANPAQDDPAAKSPPTSKMKRVMDQSQTISDDDDYQVTQKEFKRIMTNQERKSTKSK